MSLVEVRNLRKYFPAQEGSFSKTRSFVKAVNDLSFEIGEGETLGLVGESGCGKTTAGRCALRLIEPDSGEVYYNGTDILKLGKADLRNLRREIQIIFQDPYSSLNPRMTAGGIIGEPLIIHRTEQSNRREDRVRELMEIVGLNPKLRSRYPHEFSGGQRQRIGIARALSVQPRFVVADEPVSALDVSVQAQIINLLQDLQEKFKLTYLFIAHDLSVVEHISNRIAVMYLGRIVETGDARDLCREPLHPYTRALISSVPVPEPGSKAKRIFLKGDVPTPLNPPDACLFNTRCYMSEDICFEKAPELEEKRKGRFAACHLI